MKIRSNGGFTLVENIITLGMVTLLALTFSGGIILSGKLTRSAREALQAAEILDSKIENLRTCAWSQLNTTAFVPTTFKAQNGTVYSGGITLEQVTGPVLYTNRLLKVTAQVNWSSSGKARSYSTTTFISPYAFAGL